MHILHVISAIDPIAGGPAVALAGLAPAQVREGIEVSLLSTYGPGTDLSPGDQLRQKGVNVRLLGPGRGLTFTHPQLKPALAEMVAAADVVHIHSIWEDAQHQAARMAMRLGKPYIIRPCGMLTPWSLRHGWLKKKLYMLWRMRRNLNRAAAIHVASEMEAEDIARLRIKAPSIIEPNGADLSEFEHLPPPGTFRLRYPQLGKRPYVVFLGRIHQFKGLELLVPAFARAKTGDAMLVIVGPDYENFQSQVEAMVRGNRLEDRVIFTGTLRGPDRVAALADATLFSLPSYQENFGIAVVEALAAALPVVISDHVYIHREIAEARVGAVVPLDVDALASELSRWLGDEQLRKETATRSRPFVWERYDWRMIARRWKGHYERLAAAQRIA